MKFLLTITFADSTVLTIEKRFAPIPSDRQGWKRAGNWRNEFFDLTKQAGHAKIPVYGIELEQIPN